MTAFTDLFTNAGNLLDSLGRNRNDKDPPPSVAALPPTAAVVNARVAIRQARQQGDQKALVATFIRHLALRDELALEADELILLGWAATNQREFTVASWAYRTLALVPDYRGKAHELLLELEKLQTTQAHF